MIEVNGSATEAGKSLDCGIAASRIAAVDSADRAGRDAVGRRSLRAGVTLSHVYFPATSIVSLLYVLENGASAEIAVVGNEGIVGVSLFMGGESTPSRAVVQNVPNRGMQPPPFPRPATLPLATAELGPSGR
jgi:hypothetical protein